MSSKVGSLASSPAALKLPTPHDLQMFETAVEVAKFIQSKIILEPSSNTKPTLPKGEARPNPFYNQTKSGLLLELNGNFPSVLHTPLGVYRFAWAPLMIIGDSDKKCANETLGAITNPLGLKKIRDISYNDGTIFYPLYEITCFEGQPVEEATHREESEYISYDDALKIWEEYATIEGSIHSGANSEHAVEKLTI